VKSKLISFAVIAAVGVIIGMTLTYLIGGSADAARLAFGALFGGLIAVSLSFLAGDPNSNDQSGINGGG
jgi:hypothetical protein